MLKQSINQLTHKLKLICIECHCYKGCISLIHNLIQQRNSRSELLMSSFTEDSVFTSKQVQALHWNLSSNSETVFCVCVCLSVFLASSLLKGKEIMQDILVQEIFQFRKIEYAALFMKHLALIFASKIFSLHLGNIVDKDLSVSKN